MNPAVQSALVSGVVGLLLYVLTSRNNRRGQDATNAIAKATTDNEGKAVDLSVLVATVETLERQMENVQEDLAHEREQRKLSNGYARTLAQVLRDHNIPVPQQPTELDLP